ncbi:hypothetical protein [Bacillus badius]|uniref:hypothetical protein n=1 Tax=Bacillus badius TaxID=1455 RepID=UPI0005970654|nr:hypothetical protein [Bacillus badius]
MSSNHINIMLKTLKQYEDCEITLKFSNDYHTPMFTVCYLNKFFRLTYLSNPLVETYDNIESALSAIEKVMQNSLQETPN